MKASDELKKLISDLADEAEGIISRAENQGRTLNAAEEKRWTAIMDKNNGELAAAQTKLEAAVEAEEQTARLRASKALVNTAPPVYGSGFNNTFTSGPQVRTRTLQAFTGNGDRQQAERDCFDSGLWLRATLLNDAEARDKLRGRRGDSWLASMSESSPTAGGYLAPSPLSDGIIVSREQVSALRRLASIYPMTSDNLSIPKRTAGLTVYLPGEEGQITSSDITFGQISLQPRKRAVLSYLSAELRDDSIIPLTDFIVTEMGHALALQEDDEGVNGSGGSSDGGITGVLTAVNAASASVYTPTADNDDWSELTLADHLAAMSLVADKYRVPGQLQWLCSTPYKWQVLDRLALAQGGAAVSDLTNGQGVPMFLGYEVVLSDRMPTTTAVSQTSILFGNFKRAIAMGERTGVRVALSEHYKFDTDQVAIRATVRYDVNCHECGDSTTAGAVVGLATHS